MLIKVTLVSDNYLKNLVNNSMSLYECIVLTHLYRQIDPEIKLDIYLAKYLKAKYPQKIILVVLPITGLVSPFLTLF